ncbi:MAG: AMP-binding protein [Gammaproteobacteria bacterium]|jgi:fatty-acyl-CoA synthase|nr:AMP-binding protein [Gammaproteobacteria bacterium]NCF61022.1 AMP-binding protein [Gammaproteobacteria bacterium]
MALKSYAHGSGDTPLLGVTVGQLLDSAARRWPDNDALIVVDQGIRWNWRELRERARNFAAGLIALGLQPGDRVGMLAPNRAEWLVAQFGTACAGLVLVNINPAYRTPELEFALKKVGCRALISESSFKTSDYVAMLNELAPELAASEPGQLHSARMPDLRFVIRLGKQRSPGMFNFADVASKAGAEDFQALETIGRKLDFDAPINIQFTSGTTGAPKAATLTHHNIVNNASMSASIMKFTQRDRLCMPVPMYHCFGMVLGTLLCTSSGAAIVLPAAGFEADACLRAIEEERCTAVHGVPTMFIAMLDEPDFADRDTTSLRTGIMAGAPCPIELMHRVIEEMHLGEITIGYGMTETGPLSTQTLPDDPIELRVGTVGRPLPNTEIKVVDEEGHIVPRGEPGELCTRGYNVMRGYWGDPERTVKDIDAANWIRTGDIATMDEDDYLRIVGRSKDMLIRGGENIYPREIEEFLYTNPKIEQAEVVGVPDPKFGEEVAAWIKLHEGQTASESEIREFCKGRLAHFKIPTYIRFVDEFPMTVTGKVQKYLIRESMAEELGQKKSA